MLKVGGPKLIEKEYVQVFKDFHQDLAKSLSVIFVNLAKVQSCKLKASTEAYENIVLLKSIRECEEFGYLLVKLFLYFHWNSLKLVSATDYFLNDLIISESGYPESSVKFKDYSNIEYNYSNAHILDDQYIEINKIIKSYDFTIYRSYYEQLYVYIKLREELVYFNKYSLHIENYLDVFLVNSKGVELVFDPLNLRSFNGLDYRDEANVYLVGLKGQLIKEWKIDCLDVNQDNFYEKNSIPLNQLNAYIKKEIGELNKKNKNE